MSEDWQAAEREESIAYLRSLGYTVTPPAEPTPERHQDDDGNYGDHVFDDDNNDPARRYDYGDLSAGLNVIASTRAMPTTLTVTCSDPEDAQFLIKLVDLNLRMDNWRGTVTVANPRRITIGRNFITAETNGDHMPWPHANWSRGYGHPIENVTMTDAPSSAHYRGPSSTHTHDS